MGSTFFYIAAIALQLTNGFAIESMPLKCFFSQNRFLNYDANSNVSNNDDPSMSSFEVLKFGNHTIDMDGWKLETTNAEIVGLSKAILDEYSVNFVTKILQITFTSDYYVKYDYKSGGYLFSRSIEGQGVVKGVLRKTQMGMTIPFEFQKINGNDYTVLKTFNLWHVTQHAEFHFANLYNGDKKSSNTMHSLINKNWDDIVSYYGKSYYDRIGAEIFKVFKKYVLRYPMNDVSNC